MNLKSWGPLSLTLQRKYYCRYFVVIIRLKWRHENNDIVSNFWNALNRELKCFPIMSWYFQSTTIVIIHCLGIICPDYCFPGSIRRSQDWYQCMSLFCRYYKTKMTTSSRIFGMLQTEGWRVLPTMPWYFQSPKIVIMHCFGDHMPGLMLPGIQPAPPRLFQWMSLLCRYYKTKVTTSK